MRNLILSAYPKDIQLPDPFDPAINVLGTLFSSTVVNTFPVDSMFLYLTLSKLILIN